MARKVFVPVTLKVDSDGRIRPVDITWTDGHTYEIDRVMGMATSLAMTVIKSTTHTLSMKNRLKPSGWSSTSMLRAWARKW